MHTKRCLDVVLIRAVRSAFMFRLITLNALPCPSLADHVILEQEETERPRRSRGCKHAWSQQLLN